MMRPNKHIAGFLVAAVGILDVADHQQIAGHEDVFEDDFVGLGGTQRRAGPQRSDGQARGCR